MLMDSLADSGFGLLERPNNPKMHWLRLDFLLLLDQTKSKKRVKKGFSLLGNITSDLFVLFKSTIMGILILPEAFFSRQQLTRKKSSRS